MRPPVVILHAPGTNRDVEAATAARLAGGDPRIERLDDVLAAPTRLSDARMIVLPGGFSYGDDLGAGRLLAARLTALDALRAHIARGRLVLGICNGFQALVKAGFLPGDDDGLPGAVDVSLAPNAPPGFACRWVTLTADPVSPCVFTAGLSTFDAPIAHGEGRVVTRDDAARRRLHTGGHVALRYAGPNPNGSEDAIAGLTNRRGTVLGLMPHPEDHVEADACPRGPGGTLGLALFAAGVRYAAQLD